MSFNWLPRISSYAQTQLWSARQKTLRQDADSVLSSLSDKLSAVAANRYSGTANLAAQAALDRVTAATKAKAAQAQALPDDPFSGSSNNDPNSVTLPDGSSFAVDTATYLPGGTRLDLNAGTITLPDGTLIDAATGARKVDVNV